MPHLPLIKFENNEEIPAFLRRWPSDECLQEAHILLRNIDNRIQGLAARGLHPHHRVLERRAVLLEKIARFKATN